MQLCIAGASLGFAAAPAHSAGAAAGILAAAVVILSLGEIAQVGWIALAAIFAAAVVPAIAPAIVPAIGPAIGPAAVSAQARRPRMKAKRST